MIAVSAPARTRTVLVVTDQIPGHEAGFEKSGHAQYLDSFLAHFRKRGFAVTLLALRPRLDVTSIRSTDLRYDLTGPTLASIDGRYVPRSIAAFARVLLWQGFTRLPRWMQNTISAMRLRLRASQGFSHDLGRMANDDERTYVRVSVENLRPDLLVYDNIFNVCGKLGTGDRWLITHEVKYQRAQSFRERGIAVRPAHFDHNAERAVLEDVGNLIAIQWDDANEFRSLVPDARVVVVPVAIDGPARFRRDRATIDHAVFVGSGSFHNYDGLTWFLEVCWPRIRAELPEATLDVVGTVCIRLREPPAGVRYCGVGDDIDAAYERASLAIVPLRIGSGLKVKLIEALAYGLPVVTTSVGAQGLTAVDPQPFEIADDAVDFAARCVTLLRSPERCAALSTLARTCAERFTPDHAFAEFADVTERDWCAKIAAKDESGTHGGVDSPRVIVAIPTFRRPELLRELLRGLGAQQLVDVEARNVRAIVIDNDPARSAEAIVRECAVDFPIALEYVSMIEPGLSSIRNYALALGRSGCEYLAMIDDDETPEPQWLSELLRVQSRSSAEAVVGPVEPILPETAPRWIADFHSQQVPVFPDGTFLSDGWSGNCLLDMRKIERLSIAFDPALNFAGGEDQLFFRQLLAKGGRIAYASSAMAWEDTPAERRTVQFIMLRSFRRGNTLSLCDQRLSPHRSMQALRALKGVGLIGKGIIGLAIGAARRDVATVIARASDAVTGGGMLAGLFGMTYQAYRRRDVEKPR